MDEIAKLFFGLSLISFCMAIALITEGIILRHVVDTDETNEKTYKYTGLGFILFGIVIISASSYFYAVAKSYK